MAALYMSTLAVIFDINFHNNSVADNCLDGCLKMLLKYQKIVRAIMKNCVFNCNMILINKLNTIEV